MREKLGITTTKLLKLDVTWGDTLSGRLKALRKIALWVSKNSIPLSDDEFVKCYELLGFTDIKPVQTLNEEQAYFVKRFTGGSFEIKPWVSKSDDIFSKDYDVLMMVDESGSHVKTGKSVTGIYSYRSTPSSYGLEVSLPLMTGGYRLLALLTDTHWDLFKYAFANIGESSEEDIERRNETFDTKYKSYLYRKAFEHLVGKKPKYEYGLNPTMIMLVNSLYEEVIEVYAEQLDFVRMENYEKAQNSNYAKSFQTKKNIPSSVVSAMETSPFLNIGFRFVEYDKDVDLTKIPEVYDDFISILGYLPIPARQPELRFRRLGNHRAEGLYYPRISCICLDIRAISSFVHEFGHHIDYEYNPNEPLSMQEAFRGILRPTITEYAKNESMSANLYEYYSTPTEVFARAFELWVSSHLKGIDLVKPLDEYRTILGYEEFFAIDSMFENIENYFTSMFGALENKESQAKAFKENNKLEADLETKPKVYKPIFLYLRNGKKIEFEVGDTAEIGIFDKDRNTFTGSSLGLGVITETVQKDMDNLVQQARRGNTYNAIKITGLTPIPLEVIK